MQHVFYLLIFFGRYNLESAIYAVQDMCDTEAKKTGQNLITDEDLIKQASMDNIRRTVSLSQIKHDQNIS